jgi:hypothetical protein
MRTRNYLDFPSSLSRRRGFSIPLNAGFTSKESVATQYNSPKSDSNAILKLLPTRYVRYVPTRSSKVAFYKDTPSSEVLKRLSFTLLDKYLFL